MYIFLQCKINADRRSFVRLPGLGTRRHFVNRRVRTERNAVPVDEDCSRPRPTSEASDTVKRTADPKIIRRASANGG